MPEEPISSEPKPAEAKKVKAEKVKQPTIEDLPFAEFIDAHYIPALKQAFTQAGISDLSLQIQELRILGAWQNNVRKFKIYFAHNDINSPKAFSCWDAGKEPSVIEPFLVDERKATMELMVFAVMQRLNAEKWLGAN